MPLPRGFRFTHCKWGHPFDAANTYFRPDNGRQQCRTCHRERQAKYADRNKKDAEAKRQDTI